MSTDPVCPHNKLSADGYCLACYEHVPSNEMDSYIQLNSGVSVLKEFARRQSETVTSKIIEDQRLVLLLDLDGTVVYTAIDQCVPEDAPLQGADGFVLTVDGRGHPVRFRSGILAFMRRIVPLYEIHVVTMGRKGYATAIVERFNALDAQPFVTGDVLTFEDCENERVDTTHRHDTGKVFEPDSGVVTRMKKGKSPMMGKEEVQVILDDRVDVWDSRSVVQVVEWRGQEADTELDRVAGVLEEIHRRFYAEDGPHSVPEVLHAMRSGVLADTRLYFKRPKTPYINPVDFDRWWRVVQDNAREMGAEVQPGLVVEGERPTTFVVDGQPLYDVPGVSARWVEMCWIMFRRVPSGPYEVAAGDAAFAPTTDDDVLEPRRRSLSSADDSSESADTPEQRRVLALLMKKFE